MQLMSFPQAAPEPVTSLLSLCEDGCALLAKEWITFWYSSNDIKIKSLDQYFVSTDLQVWVSESVLGRKKMVSEHL